MNEAAGISFSALIESIENELALLYHPGAIQYIDDTYDGAWSAAIERFDRMLSQSNLKMAKMEGVIYRDSVLRFIEMYKAYKRGSEVDALLTSLGCNTEEVQLILK